MTSQSIQTTNANKIARVTAFSYGVVCYAIFFVTFLYALGFVGNFVVPKSIDSAPIIPLGSAFLVNVGLLGLFGLQHSSMARPGFKQWWTKFVPKSVERSTYVLFSSLCLIALFYFWQPLGVTIWQLENPCQLLSKLEIALICSTKFKTCNALRLTHSTAFGTIR